MDFDTDELVKNCISALDKDLRVSKLIYETKTGEMERISSKEELEKGEAFKFKESEMSKSYSKITTTIKYDLIGKLVDETKLTRKL